MKLESEKTATDLFFDLEQDILQAWGLKEDINTFLQKYLDSPNSMSEDDVSNYVMALMHMTELRCSKAFDTFEKYCAVRRDERDDLVEKAAQIVETEGLEPTSSVPPEPLRARLARQIRYLKSGTGFFERVTSGEFDDYKF